LAGSDGTSSGPPSTGAVPSSAHVATAKVSSSEPLPGPAPAAEVLLFDRRVVGLAVGTAMLVPGGHLVADLAGRATSGRVGLAVDTVCALLPALSALMLTSRRWSRLWFRRLHVATLVLALAALGVAITGVEARPSAAAVAASPVLVLVACRPRLHQPLPRWRALVGGAVGLTVGTGLLVSPRTGPSAVSLQLRSGRLGDAQAAIGEADARFLEDTLGVAEHVPGARCYFVRDTGTTYADVVACGPAYHRGQSDDRDSTAGGLDTTDAEDPGGGGVEGEWDVYPVRIVDARIVISSPNVGQDVSTDRLSRPDGLRPPATNGQRPSGATVDAGYVSRLDLAEPDDPRPAGGYVLVGSGRVTVDGVADPETVVDHAGVERGAPAGSHLVAFDLAFEGVGGTTLEVLSGGNRVDVTPIVAEDGENYRDGWVVAVAQDDGVAPLLEATYRGRSQRISLQTGERLGGHPLLYAPLSVSLDTEVPGATIGITVPRPEPHPEEVDIGTYTVMQADMTVFEQNLGWALPGTAWLVITVEGLEAPILFDSDLGDVDPVFRFDPSASFSLQSAGGDPIVPAGTTPTRDGNLTVVFPVHDLDRLFTFHSAPHWRLVLGEDDLSVTAPRIEQEIVFG
jgi:hypothetical protein